jgi:hypothetical protein
MEKLRIFEISVIGGPVFDTGSYRGQAQGHGDGLDLVHFPIGEDLPSGYDSRVILLRRKMH